MRMCKDKGWGVGLLVAMALSCAAVFGGCESEETDSDISATRFYIDRELVSYSAVDNFTWDTTLSGALATVRIKDFTHGDATLRVFDAEGKLLLDKFLFTPNNTIYVGWNDFVVSERTRTGTPGAWRVELGYDDFTGDITVTME